MDDKTHRRIVNNLKKAYGHLGKVIEMAENKSNSVSLVQQSLAVQGFLKTTNRLILEDHLSDGMENIVNSRFLKGTKKKKLTNEVLKLFDMAKRS